MYVTSDDKQNHPLCRIKLLDGRLDTATKVKVWEGRLALGANPLAIIYDVSDKNVKIP